MLILSVLKGPDRGKRFELPDDEPQQIGRSSESLQLSDNTISRRHAELTPDDGQWYITDLHSANGSFVNGMRVETRRLLQPGDQIRTGNTIMLFGRVVGEPPKKLRVTSAGVEAHVEASVESNDDSMIMAVPDPTEAQSVQLKALYEMTALLATVMDRKKLLERVMDLVFVYFNVDRGFILLRSGRGIDPTVVRYRDPRLAEKDKITVSQTIVQHVMRKGVGVLSTNAMADKRFAKGDSVQHVGIRSAICVPVKYKDRLYGVISIDSLMANYTFTEDQLRLLTAIGVQTGLALANADLVAQRLKQEKLAAVGQTVAALSHSIKNIIQGLRGGAEVVELGLRKENLAVVGNGWAIVSRNLMRISNLTMNMLAFSKQREPEMEMVNMPELLGEVVELVQKQYDDHQVMLIADLDSDMPPVPADTSGMHQVTLNLLSNALEAVEDEVGIVTISCHFDSDSQETVIRVADNGHGMDKDTQKHVYEPFYSTKGMRGTGLGLAVTKKIIDEHRGRIELETSSDGTTFTLILPIVPELAKKSSETHGPHLPPTEAMANEEDNEDDLHTEA